ncbi:MAG: RNA methyltransferase [Candidatus Dormiibacterota bacterium]
MPDVIGPGNELVGRLRQLARRRPPGTVLLEGPRVVEEAVRQGAVLSLLAVREGVAYQAPAARKVRLAPRAFDAISRTVTPQGVLGVAAEPQATVGAVLGAAREQGWPLVVLDGIQDPGNVGTICRTAAAAGAPAVAVLDGSADPFGPKAVRASAGAVFALRVARGRWEELADVPGWGATASGGRAPEQCELRAGDVLALGSEAHGLRRQDLQPVTIPIATGVESLNVAAAAAILLFEFRRRLTA